MLRASIAPLSRFTQKIAGKQALAAPALAAGAAVAAAALSSSADCNDEIVHPPAQPWNFGGMMDSYDAASIRRGHQVYTQVCASCHGLKRIAYRNLVGVCYSEEEAKAMAEDTDVMDGPNDEGEMFERPGKLSDYLPSPYPNEEAARFANNGAYPPDLSLIAKARHNGPDYIFALLTGYHEPPAGVPARDTQYYNPYFAGGWIGMPMPLQDGAVDYEDGTPNTASQMAKDVCAFLAWTSEPEADQRKLMGFRWCTALTVCFFFTWYYKRVKWSVIKSRRLELY
jgi:ubiquinol-cytochrome c reductase cytochrome c1 subunit